MRILRSSRGGVRQSATMWGIGSWLVSGLAAAGLARLVRRRRAHFGAEAAVGAGAAIAACLGATALDFGGLAVADARAVAFAAAIALTAIALLRLARPPRT
ncbi:MAG TPA: hypothetical protein VMS56_07275 [Thermoanaerobaculia bacterium]|nr:hypothetical protein [Thermoanaerobaculia bacterium]